MTDRQRNLADSVHVFAKPDMLRFEHDRAQAEALRAAIELEERTGPTTQVRRRLVRLALPLFGIAILLIALTIVFARP